MNQNFSKTKKKSFLLTVEYFTMFTMPLDNFRATPVRGQRTAQTQVIDVNSKQFRRDELIYIPKFSRIFNQSGVAQLL